jgi:hypothetical protein
MQPTKVFAIAELDGRTTGNKSLINFGTGVTEHEISCQANTDLLAATAWRQK